MTSTYITTFNPHKNICKDAMIAPSGEMRILRLREVTSAYLVLSDSCDGHIDGQPVSCPRERRNNH